MISYSGVARVVVVVVILITPCQHLACEEAEYLNLGDIYAVLNHQMRIVRYGCADCVVLRKSFVVFVMALRIRIVVVFFSFFFFLPSQ